MTLSQTPVNGVGERNFPQVGQKLLVNFERREVLGSLNSLLGESIDGGGLVALGVEEFVVEDLDFVVLVGQANNLVGDSLGIGVGGDVLANTAKGELDVFGLGTLQLGLALLANDDEVESVGLLGE